MKAKVTVTVKMKVQAKAILWLSYGYIMAIVRLYAGYRMAILWLSCFKALMIAYVCSMQG